MLNESTRVTGGLHGALNFLIGQFNGGTVHQVPLHLF